MNKSNKILLGILTFILVCVIGYALFSETITVSGIATAKGDFELITTCQTGDVYFGKLDYAYNSDECNVINNSVSYKANLTMPGAYRTFTFVIKNTGTIPAKLNMEEGIVSTSEFCLDSDKNGTITSTDSCGVGGIFSSDPMPVGFITTDGNILDGEEDDVSQFMDENGENFILRPNESMIVQAEFIWQENAAAAEYNNALMTYEASTVFNFNQITN